MPSGPVIVYKKELKSQGDPEISQGPDFLKNTPLGEVFQIPVVPPSETLRACR